MTTNLQRLNWQYMTIDNILSGKTSEGVKYVKLFLQDYTKLFNVKVNPSCNKCMMSYLKKYKEKMAEIQNNCDYVLHKKREGLSLKFGSNKFITNANITNSIAKQLINRFQKIHGDKTNEFLFSKYPKTEAKATQPKAKRAKKTTPKKDS